VRGCTALFCAGGEHHAAAAEQLQLGQHGSHGRQPGLSVHATVVGGGAGFHITASGHRWLDGPEHILDDEL
jgi:hypothetical protein